MRKHTYFSVALCILVAGSAAGEAPQVDSDTLAFATYVNMVSASFYLKRMMPTDDEYWSKNLKP